MLIEAHVNFVFGAFGSYFVAVLFYLGAMLKVRVFNWRYLAVFFGFTLILGSYLWLLFGGPQEGDMALTIQVTGQKIVAYAALITVFILAYGAYQKQAEI